MEDISKNLINRKEALRRAAYLLGGAISAPTVLGFLGGCSPSSAPIKNFNADQIKFLSAVSDIIIPETNTPGAAQVGVPKFMDDMIFTIWEENDRNDFLTKMKDFRATAKKELGKDFNEASPEEQKEYIYKKHEAVFGGNVDWKEPHPFIWTMKEMTITGYFASEVGMTQVLQWQLVPGYLDGCMTFEEAGGKVWAR